MSQQRAVGLFAKPVIAGEVKTRLTPPLNPERAAALYGAFVTDLTRMLDAGRFGDWTVFSTAPQAQRSTWPQAAAVPAEFVRQIGDDLGARMHHALAHLLEPAGRKAAVLIGSDLPTLDAGHIREAFRKLKDHDVVLGPSLDGGYYLVGLTAPHEELFTDMVWSSPDVLAETLTRLERLDLRPAFLPPWYDVDDAADLSFLRLHLQALTAEHGDLAPCPHTRAALGLIVADRPQPAD